MPARAKGKHRRPRRQCAIRSGRKAQVVDAGAAQRIEKIHDSEPHSEALVVASLPSLAARANPPPRQHPIPANTPRNLRKSSTNLPRPFEAREMPSPLLLDPVDDAVALLGPGTRRLHQLVGLVGVAGGHVDSPAPGLVGGGSGQRTFSRRWRRSVRMAGATWMVKGWIGIGGEARPAGPRGARRPGGSAALFK